MGKKRQREKTYDSLEQQQQLVQPLPAAVRRNVYCSAVSKKLLLGADDVVDGVAYRTKTDAEIIPSLYGGPLIEEQLQRARPNYFAAVQVSTSQELVQKISDVQAYMSKQDKRLKSSFVDPITAHITLAVFTLLTDQDVERMKQLAQTLQHKLAKQNLLQSFTIQISKLDTFQNKVLFVRICENEQILRIVRILRDHFKQGGIIVEEREFQAHLTIAKLSKAGKKGPKKIKQEVYSKFVDIDCGQVQINTLQFCSMQGRSAAEYYPVISQVQLEAF